MKQWIAGSVLVCMAASAQAAGWADKVKHPSEMPTASSKQTRNGFSAMVVVAPKGTWENEWNKKPDALPDLKEVRVAKVGDEFAVLTFFANPVLDANKQLDVVCSIKVTRPDATIAVDESNIPCAQGPLQGPVNQVHLSPAIVKFVAEPDDPVGIWRVEATVEDRHGKTLLELRTYYDYVGSGQAPQ